MKISIITATYNQAQFLSQAIESVLSQEVNCGIDYIVVNDGSTDNTLTIIEKYAELIEKGLWPVKCKNISFRYWSKPNSGFSGAMNQGLAAADGYAITWLNSDDYLMPGALETVRRAFEDRSDIDLLYGDYLKVYEDERFPPTIEPRPRKEENLETLRARGNSFVSSFFTKRILNAVGYLDESLQFAVDLDFWFKIYAAGGKSLYVPVTLGAFRIWPGSKTSTQQKQFAAERKIIARRYGGNILPQHALYKLRKKAAGPLNFLQRRTPFFYHIIKRTLYFLVDRFRYGHHATTRRPVKVESGHTDAVR